MSNTNLNAKWYTALVENTGLNPQTFQLVQGSLPVGNTSSTIWQIMDAIPPESIDQIYDGAGDNLFSTNYGTILSYLAGNDSFVTKAQEMWTQSGDFNTTKAYNTSIGILKSNIVSAPSFSFDMDSDKQSADVSGTWAKGKISGMASLFKNNGSEKLMHLIKDRGIVMNVKIDHLMTLFAVPLSTKNMLDPDLNKYEPWYISNVLSLAYKNKDAWKNHDYWKMFFGPDGSMLRRCTSLIVVDGMKVITTIKGEPVDDDLITEVGQIKGIFPLVNLCQEASFTLTRNAGQSAWAISSPQGNPLILGVNVVPVPS
jgi:hypothetical protein